MLAFLPGPETFLLEEFSRLRIIPRYTVKILGFREKKLYKGFDSKNKFLCIYKDDFKHF